MYTLMMCLIDTSTEHVESLLYFDEHFLLLGRCVSVALRLLFSASVSDPPLETKTSRSLRLYARVNEEKG